MRRGKPCLSLVIEALLRSLSASAIVYSCIALVAVLRGISQGISYPLGSDDWYLVASFLAIWCLMPSVLALSITYIYPKITHIKGYIALTITQGSLLYAYSYYVSRLPDNELTSSPLILLIYAALPIALLYYPLFFAGSSWGKIRGGFTLLAALIMMYALVIG